MFKYSDLTLTCTQCGKEFIFSEDEQEFYKTKGFTPPHRCKECRSNRRVSHPAACSKCGNSFVDDAPVYCAACQVNTQLDFEIKAQTLQSTISELNTRLNTVETEKSQVTALLQQKELQIANLEQRIKNITDDLKKASQLQSSLDWLEPALTTLKDKVTALENNQNNLVEALIQIVESKEEPHKVNGLLDVIRGIFRPNRSPIHTS